MMSFLLQGIVNMYFVYITIIDAQCGNSSWCLGVRTANFDIAESNASILFRVLLRSNYDYYWSDWISLDNRACNDFAINIWDYFEVPCFDLWYGFALENRDRDNWAVTAIKYNGNSIDTFENSEGGNLDYYWISGSMYYYFDTNGKIISNDEFDIPAPEPPTKNPSNLPTFQPTIVPTILPTKSPTIFPTNTPIFLPSASPSNTPTSFPSKKPSNMPTFLPTILPSKKASNMPTSFPTLSPMSLSTHLLTKAPTVFPTNASTKNLTKYPSNKSINPQNSDAVNQSQRTGTLIIIIIGSIIVIGCCLLCIFIAKGCGSIKENLKDMTNLSAKVSSQKSSQTNPSMYEGVFSPSSSHTKGKTSGEIIKISPLIQPNIIKDNIEMVLSTPSQLLPNPMGTTPMPTETPKDLIDSEHDIKAQNHERAKSVGIDRNNIVHIKADKPTNGDIITTTQGNDSSTESSEYNPNNDGTIDMNMITPKNVDVL